MSTSNDAQQENVSPSPALIMLFPALPALEAADLAAAISRIEQLEQPVTIETQVREEGVLHAVVRFDCHRLKLVGFDTPVPARTLEQTVRVSNWREQDKAALKDHRAHVISIYQGESPNAAEQLISLYKIAYAFSGSGLLGILDEDAWTCVPWPVMQQRMEPGCLDDWRRFPPLDLWMGFVKVLKSPNDIWYCTKGYHRFGLMDLAYLGRHGEGEDVFLMFAMLFDYMRRGGSIRPGDTAELGEKEFLRFREVYEYSTWLNGRLGTLVIEKARSR